MIWARFLKSFTKTGVAALALAGLATVGNAREVYKGKFTLAAKTQWGDVTLPAGDYTFALPSTSSPYTLYIHGNTVDAIVMAVTIDEAAVSHSAARPDGCCRCSCGAKVRSAGAGTDLYLPDTQTETAGKQGSSAKACPTRRGICGAGKRKQNIRRGLHGWSLGKSHASSCKREMQKPESCFSSEANSHSGEATQLQARYTPQHGMQCA